MEQVLKINVNGPEGPFILEIDGKAFGDNPPPNVDVNHPIVQDGLKWAIENYANNELFGVTTDE